MLKGDLVNGAYSQLRISGLTVDPSPEDVVTALDRMENMLSEWEESRNICLNYAFSDEPDPGEESNIQRWAKHAIETNLALRLIPDFGKMADPVLASQASQSFSTLSAKTANIRQTQYPQRQARGSGNTRYIPWNRYFRKPEQSPQDCTTRQLPVETTATYQVDWTPFLQDGETVSTFRVDQQNVSGDITILSQSLTDNTVSVDVEGKQIGYVQLLISITTSTARPDNRQIDVQVTQPIKA